MNRALPGWAIDLIREGVPARDLKVRGDAAVWSALRRTAMSAHQRGWGQIEWEHLVLETRSALGRQVRLREGHRERTARAVSRALASAWDSAVVWVSEQGTAWDQEQAAAEATERANLARLIVGDADQPLTEAERAVLAHAAAETDRRAMVRVALPRAALLAETGLGLTALRTALTSLEARGLLTLVERGRPRGANARKARANLYALADADAAAPYLCRETRPVVPPTQTCGAPTGSPNGAPAQTCGAPDLTTPATPTGEPTMSDTLTLTLSEAERAAVLQTLTAMRAAAPAPEPVMPVSPNGETAPGNVVPIRRAAGGAL